MASVSVAAPQIILRDVEASALMVIIHIYAYGVMRMA